MVLKAWVLGFTFSPVLMVISFLALCSDCVFFYIGVKFVLCEIFDELKLQQRGTLLLLKIKG